MRTHRLTLKRHSGFGKSAFSVFLGLAVVLLQFLLASTALAATSGSSLQQLPPQNVTRAGVSVVRLLVSYMSGSTTEGAANTTVSCTGLGVLLASREEQDSNDSGNHYENWVLTDGSLVNTSGTATCLSSQPAAQLSSIQIFTSNEYNPRQVVSFTITGSTISDAVSCLPSPSQCANGPALFSFQSAQNRPQPFIDLALSSATNRSTQAQATVMPTLSGTSTPIQTPSMATSDQVLELANKSLSLQGLNPTQSSNNSSLFAQYQKQLQSYLTPTVMAPAADGIEPGAPVVNSSGQLTGLRLSQAQTLSASDIQNFLNMVSPQLLSVADNPVHQNWNNGMDAYYHQQSMEAHDALQLAFTANPDFVAAQTFSAQALRSTANQTDQGSKSMASSPPAAQGISVSSYFLPYWELAMIGLAILLVILVFVALFASTRMRRRRTLHKELADAERQATIAARQIAEKEAAQKVSAVLPNPTAKQNVEAGLQPRIAPAAISGELSPASAPFESNSGSFAAHARSGANQPNRTPGGVGGIADQPTLVPTNRALAEQSTAEYIQSSQGIDEDGDPEKTLPFAKRKMNGQKFEFIVGTRSDPGIKRKYKPNEDSLFAAQGLLGTSSHHFGLFIVADGMGGHANGRDASRLAIQTLINYLLPKLTLGEVSADTDYSALLVDGVQAANQAVHQNNMEQHADMGTTMTGTLLVGNMAYVVNVGDSRTYLYRPSTGLKKVTTDHSVVASLVEAGIIKPDDIYTHPKRNQIYRSLGEKPVVEVDDFLVQLQAGDKLLICSDGLWDMVRDPKIEGIIRTPDPSPVMTGESLIQAAFEGGGEDNVSVIIVQVAEAKKSLEMPRLQLLAKPDTVQLPQL
ncbi:MAG TPA: protein phosphatase 2C domain-containing protein [Dictyobacter sp.]|jgi:serine/threonine protein phosphatase PrpC|nr:protein phosphatase 2C domain-containing protein [Dictyobacter sp.]